MDIVEYAKNEERFNKLLAECQSHFSADDLSEVRHYFDHRELGMAMEGFILELLRKDVTLSKSLGTEIKSLAYDLELNEDSVFDANLWEKLQDYLNRQVRDE